MPVLSASEQRAGVLAVVSAYSFWGVTPIYYKWVEFAGPLEVSAHRIVWALLILAGLVALRRQWHGVRRLTAAEFGWLAVSGGLLFINWLTFVWALQNGRIVETSLGYYINPLITVALGVVFLGERLRWPQTAALALAGAGVVNEVVAFGALPWAGLTLAITFGFYGLVRKRIRIDSAVGLGVETGLAVPLALAYLAWQAARSEGSLIAASGGEVALLALGGLVTVIPLVLFAAAANRLNLVVIGFFQFLAPTLTLLVAAFYYRQPIVDGQWLTFGCIWAALVTLSAESLHQGWRLRRHLAR